ncbi:MAG: DUF2889 domain-containing protein [Candidatus Methylomirabilia bacterium]
MPVSSPCLVDTDRYERIVYGWMDSPRSDSFATTVRITDPWVSIELAADTTPSPDYAIREARGRLLVGPQERIEPALAEAAAGLAGLSMTGGFTRNAAETLGNRPGVEYFVDAAVEVARLARQITRLPEQVVTARMREGAIGVWRLDMAGWVDLPASCYAYRPESEALFKERAVRTAAPARIYSPAVGAAGVFNRTKVLRIERCQGHLLLAHSMFDEVHSFQIWYRLDLASSTIVGAGSMTPRLPYLGICNDPQRNITALIGQTVGPTLRQQMRGLIGGMSGCAQLFELTADLLKLLSFS